MKKRWLIIMVFVALLVIVYVGGSWFFSSVLIDASTQSVDESVSRIEEMGVQFDDYPEPEMITVAADDVTLEGWYYDNPLDGQCAVMMLHGYTGTRAGTMQYAPLFWDKGCDLFAYDARGHGNSTYAYHTYGYHEKNDGVAAYEWLLAETGLEPDQVGLMGVSYGAATSLQMAPLVEDAAFIIADAPYQDAHTIVSQQGVNMFGGWVKAFVPTSFFIANLRADMKSDEISPVNAVAEVDTPILLVHSLQDEFTLPTHSEAIYDNANQETTVLQLNDWGAGHAADIFERPEEYKAFVDTFMTEFVPEFGLTGGR